MAETVYVLRLRWIKHFNRKGCKKKKNFLFIGSKQRGESWQSLSFLHLCFCWTQVYLTASCNRRLEAWNAPTARPQNINGPFSAVIGDWVMLPQPAARRAIRLYFGSSPFFSSNTWYVVDLWCFKTHESDKSSSFSELSVTLQSKLRTRISAIGNPQCHIPWITAVRWISCRWQLQMTVWVCWTQKQ